MLFYTQNLRSFQEPFLTLDGLNDIVYSEPITYWGPSQSFTFFVDIDLDSMPSNAAIFECYTSGTNIWIGRFPDASFAIYLGASVLSVPYQTGRIQISITFNAISGLATFYIDSIPLGSGTLTPIASTTNVFYIGGFQGDTKYVKGNIYNLSFVDYAKSQVEVTADYNNKKQSKGTGEYLLNIDFKNKNLISAFNSIDDNHYYFEINR